MPKNQQLHVKIYTLTHTSKEDTPMQIEAKLQEKGLVLPQAPKLPPGLTLSFACARMRGNRLYLAGHGPLAPDGSPPRPFGTRATHDSLHAAHAASPPT